MNATPSQPFAGSRARPGVELDSPFDPGAADPDADDALAATALADTDWDDRHDHGALVAEATSRSPLPATAPAVDEARLLDWIERIADRDERALSALYDATVSRVYGLVLRILRRPAWAEEVVEDTYFQVWRQALRYDAARGRALTWLLGMARSRAIDALRREHRFDHEPLEGFDESPLSDDGIAGADDWLAMAAGHALLHRALAGLGAQPRQLVALAFFRGLSHEEIAEQTALPLGTVKSQIRRALVALREVLGDGGLQALPT